MRLPVSNFERSLGCTAYTLYDQCEKSLVAVCAISGLAAILLLLPNTFTPLPVLTIVSLIACFLGRRRSTYRFVGNPSASHELAAEMWSVATTAVLLVCGPLVGVLAVGGLAGMVISS